MASLGKIDGWKYDVFLSFRGEDTRNGFTGHLYSSLRQKGINTFIDDEELERGEEISPALVKAIRESRFSVVVFSRNYASSTWCLRELVEILNCMESKGQKVLPIFYDVEPSEVRHQRGIFGKALAEHEERFKHKVQEWRTALTKTANFSGWDIRDGHESKDIQRIVEEIFNKLNHTHFFIAKHPVGVFPRLDKVYSLLAITDTKGVRMIGVYGRPGIGKTTIAKAIYNMYADKFEGSSFLKSIGEECEKESDLVRLQELLLCDVLGVKNLMNSLGNVDRGINLIKKRLRCKRVLVMLDGVTDLDQLEKLAGGLDWFGPGSRIIITTQDEQLLTEHQVSSTYRVQEMTRPEAIELFSWYAFKKKQPEADYMDHVNEVVRVAKGVPLTLVELGRLLYSTSIDLWKTILCMEAVRYSAEQMLETTGELVLDSVTEIIVSMTLESVSDSDEQMQETTDELVSDLLELVSETLESVSDSAEQMLETTDELDVTESVESVLELLETDSDSDSDWD